MAQTLLMPKATAVWLVDNTSLSFEQIAAFCAIHPLEIKAIADGDSAQGIKGLDPISTGQLSREEIEKGQNDINHKLQMSKPKVKVPERSKKAPRYTPVSRRQDRPNAILWLIRHHPELKDSQIIKLVGTTKPTIQAIRDRSHWNSANLTPSDPVILGLCTQIALDGEVTKAEKYLPPKPEQPEGETLMPVDVSVPVYPQDAPQPEINEDNIFAMPPREETASPKEEEPEYHVDSVFGKLAALKEKSESDDED